MILRVTVTTLQRMFTLNNMALRYLFDLIFIADRSCFFGIFFPITDKTICVWYIKIIFFYDELTIVMQIYLTLYWCLLFHCSGKLFTFYAAMLGDFLFVCFCDFIATGTGVLVYVTDFL